MCIKIFLTHERFIVKTVFSRIDRRQNRENRSVPDYRSPAQAEHRVSRHVISQKVKFLNRKNGKTRYFFSKLQILHSLELREAYHRAHSGGSQTVWALGLSGQLGLTPG